MHGHATRLLSAVIFSIAVCGATHAGEAWPQWLGPQRNGLNDEANLMKQWPEGGPPLVWLSREAGLGYAGPAIADGRLITLGSIDKTEMVLAFDLETGERLWSAPMGVEHAHGWGNGPQGTPAIDGDRVYGLGAQGVLVCVAADTGDVVWSVSLLDLGGQTPKWGYAESPLVHGDLVIVTPGGEQGAVAALDKATGEVRWQTEGLDDIAHYSSAVLATLNGQEQVVQLLNTRLVGLAPADGKLLWEAGWPGSTATIPTPLVHGDRVYATTGYGVGCACFQIDENNGATELYRNKDMKNKHGGFVLQDGVVYGHSERAGWVAQDFETGEKLWNERGELEMGGLGYADGMLYLVGQDSGDVVLVEASPEGWNEASRFTLAPQTELRKPRGRIWTHPVIVDGKLYLRDQELLYCFDVRAE